MKLVSIRVLIGNLIKSFCIVKIFMSRQDCINQQSNELMQKMDTEFQTLEAVIMKAFAILEEYDKLIRVTKKENIGIGGECE